MTVVAVAGGPDHVAVVVVAVAGLFLYGLGLGAEGPDRNHPTDRASPRIACRAG